MAERLLQLVLLGGRWWLLIEHDAIGQRAALLEALPIDELHVFPLEARAGRPLAAHRDALARWEVLIRFGGSLHAGGDLTAQLELCSAPNPQELALGWERLRLCCTPAVMVAIRRELDRFPPQAIRLAKPLPGHSWGRPDPRAVLPPADDPRHPYPVEVALPPWVLSGDPELRRWLFSYGGAIRLEAPQALVEEHRQWLKGALAALGPRPAGQGKHGEAEKRDAADFDLGECAHEVPALPNSPARRPSKRRRTLASGPAHPCPICGGPLVPLAPLNG